MPVNPHITYYCLLCTIVLLTVCVCVCVCCHSVIMSVDAVFTVLLILTLSCTSTLHADWAKGILHMFTPYTSAHTE